MGFAEGTKASRDPVLWLAAIAALVGTLWVMAALRAWSESARPPAYWVALPDAGFALPGVPWSEGTGDVLLQAHYGLVGVVVVLHPRPMLMVSRVITFATAVLMVGAALIPLTLTPYPRDDCASYEMPADDVWGTAQVAWLLRYLWAPHASRVCSAGLWEVHASLAGIALGLWTCNVQDLRWIGAQCRRCVWTHVCVAWAPALLTVCLCWTLIASRLQYTVPVALPVLFAWRQVQSFFRTALMPASIHANGFWSVFSLMDWACVREPVPPPTVASVPVPDAGTVVWRRLRR